MGRRNLAAMVATLAVLACGAGWAPATEDTPQGAEQPQDRRAGKEVSAVKTFVAEHIHWLGHDTFKLVGQKTVYVDPFKLKDRDKADIICITHGHADHLSPEDIAKLQGDDTVIVAPADCAKQLKGKGKIEVIKPGQKLVVQGVEIEAVPAYNVDKQFHTKASGWVGYIITLDGVRVYHAGDTDRIAEMKELRVDVALLPVSGKYVMTADEAVQAALDIRPAVAVPMHYGTIVGKVEDAQRFQEQLRGKIEVIVKQ